MVADALDLAETSPTRAFHRTGEFVGSGIGAVSAAIVLGACGWLATAVAPARWSGTEAALFVAVASVVGLLVWAVLVLAWHWMRAPYVQRDAARLRLLSIQAQARSYSLSAVEVGSWPVGNDLDVWVEVMNGGRGAQFAATIEGLGGIEEPYHNPYAHVPWAGRPRVIAEEVPSGESRRLVIGRIKRVMPSQADVDRGVARPGPPTSVWYQFTDALGVPDTRSYLLRPGEEVIARLRVSARGIPEIGYSRTFGVAMRWPGDTADVFVSLSPDANVETESRSTPFDALLDY